MINVPTDLLRTLDRSDRSAQLHARRAVARRHPAGRERADQAPADAARRRAVRQERARRDADREGRDDGQLCAAHARAQRSDARRDGARRRRRRGCASGLRSTISKGRRCARSRNSARRTRSCAADLRRTIPPRCCATCAAATTISWSRPPTSSRPRARTGAGSSRPAGARRRRPSSKARARCRWSSSARAACRGGSSVAALEAAGHRLRDHLCGRRASPAWSRRRRPASVSPAGRGAACSQRGPAGARQPAAAAAVPDVARRRLSARRAATARS